MKLIFHGHDDRYAVEQSLLAFFPEERPVYKPAEEGEDHALVTLSRSPRFNTAVTTITYHGRTARGISRTAVDPQLTEYEAERLRQKAVKLSFFKAARDITGITPSWGALTGIRPGKLASRMLEEGMTERQVDRVLRDIYFVSPERRRLCIETAEASRRAKADLKPEDISLYVGIPFCPTRCAYCSFVSQSVERTLGLVEPYLECCTGRSPMPPEWCRRRGCTSNPSTWGAVHLPPCLPTSWTVCSPGAGRSCLWRAAPSIPWRPAGRTPSTGPSWRC